MGGCQQCVEFLVEFVVPVVARPVAGIMADIEGLVAFGRLCQWTGFLLIRIVVAIGFSRISLELINCRKVLCYGRQAQQTDGQGDD